MDGKYSLDSSEILISVTEVVKKYRDKSCLPIVAVNNIGAEIQERECAKRCFGEKCELLNIIGNISIRLRSVKIIFVINKIECNTFVLQFQNSHILLPPIQIHIKMSLINKLILPFFLHTYILWNHHTHVVFLFVKIFRK